MHRVGGKRGQAYGYVLGPSLFGRAVAHPLSRGGDDGLPGPYLERPGVVLDPEQSSQHDRNFLELRPLTGLEPSRRRDHPGNAHSRMAGIHAANVLLYFLGLRASGLHDSRRGNQSRHGRELTRKGLALNLIRSYG